MLAGKYLDLLNFPRKQNKQCKQVYYLYYFNAFYCDNSNAKK